jgi:methionyl aminopeptidase
MPLPLDDIIEYYLRAGKIASSALRYAVDLVGPKKRINIYELSNSIESFIKSKGADLAFPCNIGFNEIAAHYSPLYPDDEILFDKGLLKIDVGAMIKGYIADTAITIARGYEYQYIARINREILEDALHIFRPNVSLGEIGRYIENRAKSSGYKPISNLSGHLIGNYTLHGGKNVPNVNQFLSPKIEKDEVYAVEPFLTYNEGAGEVVNSNLLQIYSLSKMKKVKDKKLNALKEYIYRNYRFLPFSPKWLVGKFGESTYPYVDSLYKLRYLRGYPTLVERKNAAVSQFEHTIIVTDDEPIVLTKPL